MTLFDLIVVSVILASTAFAVVRGALREIGTLVVLAGAGGAAFGLIKPAQAVAGLGDSFLATAAIGGAIALVAFIGLYLGLHVALTRVRLKGRALQADRIGGGVFGLARGLALVGLGFLAYSYYLDESRRPEAVRGAFTLPMAEGAADFFESFAPEGTGLEDGAKVKAEDDAAALGYGRGDRAGLSELVSTVTTSDGPAASRPAPPDDPIAAAVRELDPE